VVQKRIQLFQQATAMSFFLSIKYHIINKTALANNSFHGYITVGLLQ